MKTNAPKSRTKVPAEKPSTDAELQKNEILEQAAKWTRQQRLQVIQALKEIVVALQDLSGKSEVFDGILFSYPILHHATKGMPHVQLRREAAILERNAGRMRAQANGLEARLNSAN